MIATKTNLLNQPEKIPVVCRLRANVLIEIHAIHVINRTEAIALRQEGPQFIAGNVYLSPNSETGIEAI